jgi:hypothetical protein
MDFDEPVLFPILTHRPLNLCLYFEDQSAFGPPKIEEFPVHPGFDPGLRRRGYVDRQSGIRQAEMFDRLNLNLESSQPDLLVLYDDPGYPDDGFPGEPRYGLSEFRLRLVVNDALDFPPSILITRNRIRFCDRTV